MSRILMKLVHGAAVCLLAVNSASASLQTWGFYNTGVDNAGNVLTPQTVDSHYSGASATNPANPWLANTTTSVWITPSQYATASGAPLAPGNGATYDYTLTVNSPGSWLTVDGRWASDNGAEIFLNGSLTPSVTLAAGGPLPAATSFNTWTDFTLSGFQEGINTILFRVTNTTLSGPDPNPTGLRVEFSGYQVPEATSMLVWGGLALTGSFARRRRS